MKIIFVCGVLNPPYQLWGWQKDLKKAFPQAEVVTPYRFYYCTFVPQIRRFIEDVRKEVKSTEEDTLIVAHSFGGLVSKKALETVKRRNIKLVTLATPHGRTLLTRWGECESAKRRLAIPGSCRFLCKTYGGDYDLVVRPQISWQGEVPHETLPCLHTSFLFDRMIRQKIVEETLRPLSQKF